MSKLPKRSRPRYQSAAEGPSTPEIDDPAPDVEPPTKADADWAASNMNEDWHDDKVPDEVWDALADEAEARDRLERGLI